MVQDMANGFHGLALSCACLKIPASILHFKQFGELGLAKKLRGEWDAKGKA